MAWPGGSVKSLGLVLSPSLDQQGAVALRDILLQGLERQAALRLDASRVTQVSTAALQVISAFVIEAQKASIRIEIADPSPVLAQAFDDLGLSHILRNSRAVLHDP